MGSTLRIFHPLPGVLAFYDGRVAGVRLHSEGPNWLDDGAYALGICSYAVVSGEEAIVYDTHISLEHARAIRRELERLGVRSIRVVLSHWHDDHVAGNEVFADCEILAHAFTADVLAENRVEMEAADPPIKPLVMPTRLYENELELRVGDEEILLRHADVHSRDGTIVHLPKTGVLFAGDTLEDPITYVAEPNRLDTHLEGLRRIAELEIHRILPNHGSAAKIGSGGYDRSLIGATESYVRKLLRCRRESDLRNEDLRSFIAQDLASGAVSYFSDYEKVHRHNVRMVCGGEG